jgi:hypothetical protein
VACTQCVRYGKHLLTPLAAWQIDGKARLVSARTPMRLAPVPSTSRMTFDERSVLSARPQREPSSPGLSPSRINLVDSTTVHQGSIASSLLGITSRVNPAPQYAQSRALPPPPPPHNGQRTPTRRRLFRSAAPAPSERSLQTQVSVAQ